jgi:hypothetical protein
MASLSHLLKSWIQLGVSLFAYKSSRVGQPTHHSLLVLLQPSGTCMSTTTQHPNKGHSRHSPLSLVCYTRDDNLLPSWYTAHFLASSRRHQHLFTFALFFFLHMQKLLKSNSNKETLYSLKTSRTQPQGTIYLYASR